MGLFNKIKKAFSGNGAEESELEDVIVKSFTEYASKHDHFFNLDISTTKVWTEQVKNWPDKQKVRLVLYLVPIIHRIYYGTNNWNWDDPQVRLVQVRQSYIQNLFRNKLIMDDEDAINIYESFVNHPSTSWEGITRWPLAQFINQLEKQRQDVVLSAELRTMLQNLKAKIAAIDEFHGRKDRIKMIDRIDVILFEKENNAVKPAKFLGEDELATFANAAIGAMPENEKIFWYKLLALAQKTSGSKPTKKYLDETKALIKEAGIEKFRKTMQEWMQFLVDLKETEEHGRYTYAGTTINYVNQHYITSVNADTMKALVWICSHFHDNATIQLVAALAERAFKKIPGQGQASTTLGNGCLYALYKSKGLDGIGQLSRLKLRVKHPSTQTLIEKYLLAAAEEQGVSVSEIEDMAIDDCGLANGARTFLLDDYKAELVITGVGKTEIKWFKPDGSQQKAVPAVIKEKQAAKLKKIKDTAKQVEQTVTGQRDRIDRMFRDDRIISKENFEQYYLNHGLVSYLTNGIIWNFHLPDNTVSAIHLNNTWVNQRNEIVDIASAETVSLWHPVHATVDEIKAWRDFFVFHQLQQPLKQAYREVYLLTDAELNTSVYSNRMAAHILRQHQFNQLAKARGWRYTLMGSFDNGHDNKASLLLPQHELRVEYWLSEVNADGAAGESGIWFYISTDQVRFINTTTNETVELVNIPPLVFSEVMRDVDLFVGVASVGNDPTWNDTGGLPVYHDYWQSYSFGELSELAKNRKEILAGLIPRLKIKDVAFIKDKFLVVKGKLRTYKIHIGSTNILMEPNDQYLCIVPDRGQKNHTENLFLPFEGDTGLSIVLSKAFLLADDDKITDSTITSQINPRR